MAATAPPVAGAPPSAPVRRRPPKRGPSRVSTSIWVAVVAGVLAVIANVGALGGRGGVPVLVAVRAVNLGEPVTAADFRLENAAVPAGVLSQLLHPGDLDTIAGKVATHAIAAGAPVTRTDLAASVTPDRQRAMSIPVEVEHAVGGRLEQGDTIDVIDSSTGIAVYVVVAAPVLDIGVQSSSRSSLGSGGKYALTVAVDAEAALRLSAAIDAGHIDVVRSTGATPAVR